MKRLQPRILAGLEPVRAVDNQPCTVKTAVITPYGTGGSLLYVKELMSAMSARRYQVLFYLPGKTDTGTAHNPLVHYNLKDPSVPPGSVKAKIFKYPFHLSKYLYNSFAINPREGIEVAHLLFPYYLTDLITIKRLKKRGLKVILTVHEVFPHKPLLGGKVDKAITARMYEEATLLLVHSDSLKNEIIQSFPLDHSKIHVVPHGYFGLPESPMERAALMEKYRVPDGRKVLLFFGSIRENKGLDILLQSMRVLRDDYFLLIAGGSAGVSETPVGFYKKIIRDNKIESAIAWIDRFITEEEVSEVFKVADAVILPYKNNFHAQSGVLNTAIGYEKPCVVSDVGGIGETVREYCLGSVVRAEDSDDLINGISALFKNRNVFDFDRYKRENNWGVIADKLISIYNTLLRK